MSVQLTIVLALVASALLALSLLLVVRRRQKAPADTRWTDYLNHRSGRTNHLTKYAITPESLVICSPPTDKGRSHALADHLIIGRDSYCDVVLDDGYSSQQHARLYRRGDHHLLEDLGSANGTYVNRQRVSTATVVHTGDQIQIGTTVFEVMP